MFYNGLEVTYQTENKDLIGFRVVVKVFAENKQSLPAKGLF